MHAMGLYPDVILFLIYMYFMKVLPEMRYTKFDIICTSCRNSTRPRLGLWVYKCLVSTLFQLYGGDPFFW